MGALAATVLGALACTSNSATPPTSSAGDSSAISSKRHATAQPSTRFRPNTGITVTGRAPKPTETAAPGIQVAPPDDISFGIGALTYKVAANDWNTITASTKVPRTVIVDLDPDFHASPTTRVRFQYLGDFIAVHNGPDLAVRPIAAVPDPDHRDVVVVAAVVNPAPTAIKITGLTIKVRLGPPWVTETVATAYTAPGSHLSVGPETVSFVRLTSPLLSAPRRAARMQFDVSMSSANCPTVAC